MPRYVVATARDRAGTADPGAQLSAHRTLGIIGVVQAAGMIITPVMVIIGKPSPIG